MVKRAAEIATFLDFIVFSLKNAVFSPRLSARRPHSDDANA
jgi:hypothetical protein